MLLDIRFLALVNASKETAPNWKTLFAIEVLKRNFPKCYFEEFTTPENQYAVESFIEAQRQFESDKDISDFTRETFLNLLGSFIIANKLPISFT